MATEPVPSQGPSSAGYSTVTTASGLEISSTEPKEAMEAAISVTDAARALGKASAEKRYGTKEAPDGEQKEPAAVEAKPAEEKAPRKGNPRHDPSARVSQAVREKNEALAQLEHERRERAREKAEWEARQAAPAAAEAKPKAPQPEDYATYEEFVDAKAEFKAREVAAKMLEEREREQYNQFRQRNYAETVDGAYNAAGQAFADFQAKTPFTPERKAELTEFMDTLEPSFARSQGEPLMASHLIADEILGNPTIAPPLALYFLEHPEEVQRLDELPSELDARAEIRMLSRSLGTAATTATAPQVEISRAPKPVRPVTGALPAAEPQDIHGELTLDEFLRRKKANRKL